MKQEINAFDYAGQLCQALPGGVLLTTKRGEEVDTMTIGWGHIGIEWGKLIFVAYVRESRYTHEMIEATNEFTVNIPYGNVDKHILGYCGTKSGRDVNKIQDLGLTLVESDHVAAPGIKELPVTLECKVIYKQLQDISVIPQNIQDRYYPADAQGKQDIHHAYYGEIVGAYLIQD